MRGKLGRFSGRAPLDPASIAGLTGWWDASEPSTMFTVAFFGGSQVSADGAVARFESKAGSGFDFNQSTVGSRPIRKTAQQNGLDVLRFDGSDDRMVGPQFSQLFSNTASTCFVVAKAVSASSNSNDPIANAAVFSESDGSHGFFAVRSNDTVYSFGYSNAYATASLSYTAGNWACLATDHNGSTLRISKNKTNTSSASLGTRSFVSGNTILGANWFQNVFFNGDVGEIITYNTALSDSNRAKVEDYLIAKWGIS
jgi:hypothetical protein